MDNSGMFLGSGSNLVVHGKIEKLTSSGDSTTAPTISIYTSKDQGNIELINTGAMLKWNLGQIPSPDYRLGKSFNLRGTSLKVTYKDSVGEGTANGLHGHVDSGSFNLVFAKGSNLETTVTKASDSQRAGGTVEHYKITDEGLANRIQRNL